METDGREDVVVRVRDLDGAGTVRRVGADRDHALHARGASRVDGAVVDAVEVEMAVVVAPTQRTRRVKVG